MQHVEEMQTNLEGSAGVEAGAAKAKPERAKSASPWSATLIGAQVMIVASVLGTGYVISGKVDAAVAHARAGTERVEAIERRAKTLVEDTSAVRQEVTDIQRKVASQMSEEIIFLKIMVIQRNLDPAFARQVANLVHRYSMLYGQDPDLVLSIISVESRFDPNIESSAGALGLMQVMPQWKKVLAIPEDLRDPETSIKYGLQILGFYQGMYKDMELALTAYNRGPGPVDFALRKGEDPKNKYAPAVLQKYNYLRALNPG